MKLIDESYRCQTKLVSRNYASSTNQQLLFESSLVNARIHAYTYIHASQSYERTKRETMNLALYIYTQTHKYKHTYMHANTHTCTYIDTYEMHNTIHINIHSHTKKNYTTICLCKYTDTLKIENIHIKAHSHYNTCTFTGSQKCMFRHNPCVYQYTHTH